MNRNQVRKYFKSAGPVILPVIHVLDFEQTRRNINVAIAESVPGVVLINHDFGIKEFLPIIRQVRKEFPALWFGVNFLGVTGAVAFPILASLQVENCKVDAYWADNARIDERRDFDDQPEARHISQVKTDCAWNGLYLGGVAFKKQRGVAAEQFERAARIGTQFVDVVTTSGLATGKAADFSKIRKFRSGCEEQALAIASGITPGNVSEYIEYVDVILVSTGINRDGDFYNIDPIRLRNLVQRCSDVSTLTGSENRKEPDYMKLMAPRSRGEKYAWLDPSSAYINASSFHEILDDLAAPFSADEFDVVAGIDAAGFVLAGALAVRFGTGMLTLRKGGKVPVDFDVVPMVNYSAKTQELEMRKPAFAPNTRVLLVDQWIETGGTMDAAIRLIERQHGIVTGIAVICIEENPFTIQMRTKYKMSSCVLAGTDLQDQCNRQTLDSFNEFDPSEYFPDTG